MRVTRLLLLLLLAITPPLYAGSLDSTVIGMFPTDVGDFGYADLNHARQLSWFPQLEAQLVPVPLFGFEQFLETAQMNQASPITEVAWASVTPSHPDTDNSTSGNGQPVGIAIGDFDADSIKSFLDSRQIHTVLAGNYTIYASGTGSGSSDVFFTFVDSRTIAFGPLEPLKRVLRVRDGEEDNLLQNEKMMTLIDNANGEGIFWGVLDDTGAGRIIEHLVPEAAKFPQSHDLIGKLKEVLITVKADSDIELDFQATSASPSDAIVISQLLQAGVLLRRYQTNTEDNPELGQLLDAIRIAANGNLLQVSLDFTNDQLINLIEHNTFTGML